MVSTHSWSRRATLPSPGVALLRACATAAEEGPSAAVSSPSASTAAPHVERELGDHHAESMRLLDSLDAWLRRQTVASVLPRSEAQALLDDLRRAPEFRGHTGRPTKLTRRAEFRKRRALES